MTCQHRCHHQAQDGKARIPGGKGEVDGMEAEVREAGEEAEQEEPDELFVETSSKEDIADLG